MLVSKKVVTKDVELVVMMVALMAWRKAAL